MWFIPILILIISPVYFCAIKLSQSPLSQPLKLPLQPHKRHLFHFHHRRRHHRNFRRFSRFGSYLCPLLSLHSLIKVVCHEPKPMIRSCFLVQRFTDFLYLPLLIVELIVDFLWALGLHRLLDYLMKFGREAESIRIVEQYIQDLAFHHLYFNLRYDKPQLFLQSLQNTHLSLSQSISDPHSPINVSKGMSLIIVSDQAPKGSLYQFQLPY